MIIGIDGNEANVEKKVGVSEYAYELLWQFFKYQVSSIKYQVYLKDNPRDDLPKEQDGWTYRAVRPRKLWTQIGLPLDLYLHRPRPDVFFTPGHYAPRFSPVPTVIAIMDLSYVHFPEMFKKSDLYQLKNWTAYSVKNARKILTISEASKNDIIEHYRVEPERVVVTYPGIKQVLSSKYKAMPAGRRVLSMENLKKKYGIEGEYILFVGTLQPRKNIARLIEAFSLLCHPEHFDYHSERSEESQYKLREGSLSQRDSIAPPSAGLQNDIKLIVVGKPGWMYEEIYQAPKKFGVEDRVKFLDYVPDEDLTSLYKNALCFVLPSLYEGFGLPVLEAMALGCPVVVSNTSSLPEVGGEAAVYIDPENVESIKEGIEKVVGDKKLREKMIKKGYEQVKKFSWEKCARETLKVLEEVAAK